MAYKGYKPSNNKHVYRYESTHYKRILLRLDLSFYNDVLSPICKQMNIPVATFIKLAIEEKISGITKK